MALVKFEITQMDLDAGAKVLPAAFEMEIPDEFLPKE
jgi:hypothetical protein